MTDVQKEALAVLAEVWDLSPCLYQRLTAFAMKQLAEEQTA